MISNEKNIPNIGDVDLLFEPSKRGNNDIANKKREEMINGLINNEIPKTYFDSRCQHAKRWLVIKDSVETFLTKLCEERTIKRSDINILSTIKGGRGRSYDFEVKMRKPQAQEDIIIKVEFKYGVTKINQAPQFYSPCKTSQYFSSSEFVSFEQWFYDNYLHKIANYSSELQLPNKEEYIETINNIEVRCMSKYRELYKNDMNFNKYSKKQSSIAIKEFIEISQPYLDFRKLSEKMKEKQDNKVYMLCKNGELRMERLDKDFYEITELDHITNTDYIYKTRNEMKIRIKLRFKNGNGINFPAFQISRFIPKVKELKCICKEKELKVTSKMRKDDLIAMLDENNIVY